MFWTSNKLPLKEDERKWIEDSLHWLIRQFGSEYFLGRRMILPDSSFFPDKFHGTKACVDGLVTRICGYMDVDPNRVEVELFSDRDDTVSKHRLGEEQYSGAAGLYLHPGTPNDRIKVSINTSKLNNPTALVATVAHELGHVILLADGRLSREDKSHEYMTDLLTVFLGLGIFTANAVVQFSQWQDHSHQGWSISRQGYMTEEMFGYALAACAWMRNNSGNAWERHLSVNVKHYFKTSLNYLEKGGTTSLSKLRQ